MEQSSHLLSLNLFSPERCLVQGALVEEIILIGTEGEIQILPGHAPMIGLIEPGAFKYKLQGHRFVEGFISTGFFKVFENQLQIIAETLELKDEIDPLRAKQAQKKAEEVLSEAFLDDVQLKKYQLKLQRAIIRQQLASLK